MLLALLLVAGGLAAPRIRDLDTQIRGAEGGNIGMEFASVQNAAKRVTTLQRMKLVKEAVKMWASQHGVPEADDLDNAVGKETATDGWGRPLVLVPPTADYDGCLRSYGPDGVRSKDDVTILVKWKDVHISRVAPGWQ